LNRCGHTRAGPGKNSMTGRSKLASVPIGRDDDAALKTRLTGVPLEENILTLDYYR